MENSKCCNSENKTDKNPKVKIVKIMAKSAVVSTLSESKTAEKSCCCGDVEQSNCCSTSSEYITKYDRKDRWIIGEINTLEGKIPVVSTKLIFSDIMGRVKVRLGIGRMNYKVSPGLYAAGKPDSSSPVLVTANYKLTFDTLRKEVNAVNAWIMVLDTKGVNVWCAAGKGTFGTKELLNRISKTKLSRVVSHKILILPQLGAPGISAHEVTKETGFKVVYGPVRAEDIKVFLSSGMKAKEEMREVSFKLADRAVLTPIEFVNTLKIAMLVFGFMFIINLFAVNPFGIIDFYAFMGALFTGSVLTPILLPWIPVRAFAAKGWILGILWATTLNFLNGWSAKPIYGLLKSIAYLLILPAVASYYSMNFTGSSTYTSFSGVIKEMKVAVPAIALSISLGVVLLLINCFIHV